MVSRMMVLSTLLLASTQLIHGLTCYEKDNYTGEIKETDNATMCVFIPPTDDGAPPMFHALTEASENLRPLVNFYSALNNPPRYNVLTICLHDQYDFSEIMPTEYLFRCYCNVDHCNVGGTFNTFLKHVRDTQPNSPKYIKFGHVL